MFLLLAAIALSSLAGVRSDAQLRAQAGTVLNARSSGSLRHVASCHGLEVYGRPAGGYAVMARDDRFPALLAYSPDGKFSLDSDNPGLKWWLNAVTKRLAQVNAPRVTVTKPDTTRFASHVDPLLTSLWGQREPFKFMCPFDRYVPDGSLYGTYQPDSGHYSLGCGPAAMAQYMYYYKYPKHGIGSGSVDVKYDQASVTLSVDFAAATYDWDNMIDDYQGDYTEAQGYAVAERPNQLRRAHLDGDGLCRALIRTSHLLFGEGHQYGRVYHCRP